MKSQDLKFNKHNIATTVKTGHVASVINSFGLKILEGETNKLDISQLADGIYFLKAIGYDGTNSFHKFIKN